MDFEKGVCSFDGQKFRELMERIKATQNIHAVPRGQWNSVKDSDAILFMETHLGDFLALEKNSRSSRKHSSSKTPPTVRGEDSRGYSARSITLPQAPALGSRAPNTTRPTLA